MPQASAYSEEHRRNITLDEAHALYFAQEKEKRKRFRFSCGDPKCRAMLHPLIVGALYDQEDLPGKKLRSPYFRAHPDYLHIDSCTWKNDTDNTQTSSKNPANTKPSGSVLESCGLIFKVEHSKISKDTGSNSSEPRLPEETNEKLGAEDGQNPRPQTTKFMATVAACYLKFTEEQRKNVGSS